MCVCVEEALLARAPRGPMLAAAAEPLLSWPSSCRSLARSFLAVAPGAVPLPVPVPAAAVPDRSSCTSSISPRSPHSPWPHYGHTEKSSLEFKVLNG